MGEQFLGTTKTHHVFAVQTGRMAQRVVFAPRVCMSMHRCSECWVKGAETWDESTEEFTGTSRFKCILCSSSYMKSAAMQANCKP